MARLLVLSLVGLAIAYYGSVVAAHLRDRLGELREPVAGDRERASELVACASCGVHLPRPRAFEAPEDRGVVTGSVRFYCSETCWQRSRR